jgi:hypothetical protein
MKYIQIVSPLIIFVLLSNNISLAQMKHHLTLEKKDGLLLVEQNKQILLGYQYEEILKWK